MKLTIKQPDLLKLLNYLSVDGIYPYAVLVPGDKALVSSQPEKSGLGWRFCMFASKYFESYEPDDNACKIDVAEAKKFVSLYATDEIITLQYPSPAKNAENKLQISSKNAIDYLDTGTIEDKEKRHKLPFKTEDGYPFIQKGKVKLGTHITINKDVLTKLQKRASAHGSEYYRFIIGKQETLITRLGDVKAVANHSTVKPESTVHSHEKTLDCTFTRGFKELSNTIIDSLDMYMKTASAGWFVEKGDHYFFGILLSPAKQRK